MAIECKLCNKMFEKLISSTHLKFTHNTTSANYKKEFGENCLTCNGYGRICLLYTCDAADDHNSV
jgi:hypothetical protein